MSGGGGDLFDDDYSSSGHWSAMRFSHTSTFDTLAMDPDLKQEIKSDLLEFCKSEAYYAQVGRSWKRGYLLYGQPGTGKTSLVAAIANFLDFDVYDLELASVDSNDYLRTLLVSTSPRSVIVVEDIDCTVDLPKRGEERDPSHGGGGSGRFSLSGVLNCVDGLSSSCWGERLMIFTTNHKDSLDPALLRPGRMDKHIYMGYCGVAAFKVLAKNYLKMAGDHELMGEVEELLPSARMTPAEIAEIMLGCKNHPERGMELVVETMRKQKIIKETETETNNGDNAVSPPS